MTESQAPESNLIFSIRNHYKAVPYPGSGPRPDGSENHGCKIIKGRVADVDLIPEVLDNSALKNAVIALNDRATPFLTIGCEKSCNKAKVGDGYWMRGFLELAFNYAPVMADAQNYFKVFFDFTHWFWDQPKAAIIEYEFQLEGAQFLEKGVQGFSLVLWINTLVLPTEEEAKKAWGWGLDTFVKFLMTIPDKPTIPGRLY
jgi:hypothetical protein